MLNQIKILSRHQSSQSKYSILIPTWNNIDYLKLCIKSILKNSTFHHQIIVLINEGSDGTLEWVKSQPSLDFVYSPENIGICYGLNICRQLVKTKYIVYMNDDMYVIPGWDQAFAEEINQLGHHEFMLSSTMIEPIDTGNECVLVSNFGTDIKSFKEERLLKEITKLKKDDWLGSTWPPIILPVELWDMVGGMSIEFSPGMYSDPDLSMKLWSLGVRYFKGLGNSRVYHFGSKSTARVKKNKGANLFLNKWGITARTFTSFYLRRGQPFIGVLTEPKLSSLVKLKNKFKQAKSWWSTGVI